MSLLENQIDGIFVTATELDLNMFRPLFFRELKWNLSTQVNGIFLFLDYFQPKEWSSIAASFTFWLALCYIQVLHVS